MWLVTERMAKGEIQSQYFSDPSPLPGISAGHFDQMDAFTMEVFGNEHERSHQIFFYVVCPPLFIKGKLIRGIAHTNGADYLLTKFSWLSDFFDVVANSMWSSFPWTSRSPGIFSLYPCADRERWFRERYPQRAEQQIIPLQDSDFLNERWFTPRTSDKTIDILCVARPSKSKNLPLVAEASKTVAKELSRTITLCIAPGKSPDEFTEIESDIISSINDDLESSNVNLLVPRALRGGPQSLDRSAAWLRWNPDVTGYAAWAKGAMPR
jgi:glycosyltransferase involved in cell wall biosynthesis